MAIGSQLLPLATGAVDEFLAHKIVGGVFSLVRVSTADFYSRLDALEASQAFAKVDDIVYLTANHTGATDPGLVVTRTIDNTGTGYGHTYVDATSLARSNGGPIGYCLAHYAPTATLYSMNHLNGIQFEPIIDIGTGQTILTMAAVVSKPVILSGRVPSFSHFIASDTVGNPANCFDTQIAYYVTDMFSATDNFSLYSEGAGVKLYNSGSAGFGIPTPSAKVHVYGLSGATGELIRLETGVARATGGGAYMGFQDSSGQKGYIGFVGPDSTNSLSLVSLLGNIYLGTPSSFHVLPAAAGSINLGGTSAKWNTVYAVNGTINTSDIRKKFLKPEFDLGLDFIRGIKTGAYVWKDDLDGPVHWGAFAQQVREKLDDRGIPQNSFAIYDEDADEWSLSYNDFVQPIISSIQTLDTRVAALEGATIH